MATARSVNTPHVRRAKGWQGVGSGVSATTAHTCYTGAAAPSLADTDARNWRETKWTARDGYSSQGTDGVTASGSIHTGRD